MTTRLLLALAWAGCGFLAWGISVGAEATKLYAEYDRKADEAAARTKALRVDTLNENARKAASEICGAFDIRQPRGTRYHYTNEETIAIIIAQNMKGLHR